jgi:hypothetical protein
MVEFLPSNHAVQRINREVQASLVHVQQNAFTRAFPDAHAYCTRVLEDLRIGIPLPEELRDKPATDVSDLTFADLEKLWSQLVRAAGTQEPGAGMLAASLAQHSQLLRAFEDPASMLEWTLTKVAGIVEGLPRTDADIEVGSNPGDVLDPFILAATQVLLYSGNFEEAIGGTVAHKALMMLEDMMGHLHEEVLGRMRGNMKAPEPRGENQELYDAFLNPFPGADIIQPPLQAGEPLRLHQVKSKTGTLNSSGGARLAEQMRQLRMRYSSAEIYSHSLVGRTLRGHRSKGGMLRVEPQLIVTVGETAFRILTGSSNGAELLLRLYQNAFRIAAERSGYNVGATAALITQAFRAKADAAGEGFLELMLHEVTRGEPRDQDSRTYQSRTRRFSRAPRKQT